MKTESTRRILFVLMLLVVPFLFTSCIDYVQSYSFSDGMYHLYTKVTINKTIFAMADQNPDELFPGDELASPAEFPPGTFVKKVDSDFDVGFELSVEIDPYTTDDEMKEVLPTVAGNKCYIPFIMSTAMKEEAAVTDMDAADGMTMLLMADSKCRIMIEKKIIPSISRAYFEGFEGEADYDIPVYDYGSTWCAEIPVITLYNDDSFKTDRLVLLKE